MTQNGSFRNIETYTLLTDSESDTKIRPATHTHTHTHKYLLASFGILDVLQCILGVLCAVQEIPAIVSCNIWFIFLDPVLQTHPDRHRQTHPDTPRHTHLYETKQARTRKHTHIFSYIQSFYLSNAYMCQNVCVKVYICECVFAYVYVCGCVCAYS